MNFGLQKKLQDSDFRAVCVLIFSGIFVSVAWWLNATLVYDDIAFPDNFSGLVDRSGWFKALIQIFCLDLPHEYRTYGLSRIIQFLLWSLGGASLPVYTVFISLSQLATMLAFYALLKSLRVERINALALGLMWLFSPFIWTSCFHHYSYLILPVQITIIGSYFLVTMTEVKQKKILAVWLGIALALTGELHLITVSFVLIVIAVASGARSTLRASFLAISSMMLTIVTHYLIWKTFAADNVQRQRFTFNLFHDMSYWTDRIFVAVRGIGRSIVEQLSEIVGHDILLLVTTTTISSLLVFISIAWVLDKRGKDVTQGKISRRSSLNLAGILFTASCIYLVTFVVVVILADSVPQTMPRRYGYISLTIMISAISLALSVLASRQLTRIILLSVLLGSMVTFFIRHHGFVIPATKEADDKLSEMISNVLKEDPTKAILFFRASEKIFPRISMDGATPGPAMRDVTSAEVSQAKYGTYWPAFLNITKVLGAPLTCEIGSVHRNGKVKLVCPPWQSNPAVIDGSKVIIVANLGFDEFDPFGKQVRVFAYYNEFEPYFFAKQIVRDIDWAESSANDVVAIDLGSTSSKAAGDDMLPDKHFNDPTTTSKKWLTNYGWMAGEDSVYKLPSVSINSEYYRSNRNGSFDYAFKFLESDVIIDMDFWELWRDKPGQRIFEVQVSWNDGAWVPLGNVDAALINGKKPFSIRLTRENTHSFAFRLSPVPGTEDIPFIQGVRISRRIALSLQHL